MKRFFTAFLSCVVLFGLSFGGDEISGARGVKKFRGECAEALSEHFPSACGDLKAPFSPRLKLSNGDAEALDKIEKNPEIAEEELKEMSSEGKAAAFFRLGNIYYERGEYGRASEFYSKAVEINPLFFAARKNLGFVAALMGDEKLAEEELRVALALSGGSDAKILLWFCDRRSEKGDYSSALEFCNRAILYSPGNFSALRAKAWLLFKSGLYGECSALCASLLEDCGDSFDLWRVKISADLLSENFRGAEAACETLRILSMDNSSTNLILAKLLYDRGDYSRCSEVSSDVLKDSKDPKRALRLLCASLSAEGRYSEIIDACSNFTDEAETALCVAEACLKLGRDGEAERLFRAVLEKRPSCARAEFGLGKVLSKKGCTESLAEAETLFMAASSDEAFFVASSAEILKLRSRAGDIEGTLKAARALEKKNPSPEISAYVESLENFLKRRNK